MSDLVPLDLRVPLAGRDLRHAALALLQRHGVTSIRELLGLLRRSGFTVSGGDQANKVLSDALRVEVRRGRLRRVGWGRYAVQRIARTTAWRVRRRWDWATHGRTGDPLTSTALPGLHAGADAGDPAVDAWLVWIAAGGRRTSPSPLVHPGSDLEGRALRRSATTGPT